MESNKRKCLSFETKLEIIEEVEKRQKSKAEICRENRIATSTLSTFLKDKDKIRAAVEQGTLKHKRQRTMVYDDVDKALLVWFKQARSKDVPISGPVLIKKGEELAKTLGHTDFKMSGGWLDRFKLRHGIVMKRVCGELTSAKNISIREWKSKLQSILKDFKPCNIFNADETGLFYKCLPNNSLAENCSGQKVPTERISLLCAANMDGSEKLPLLAVGKFERSRCFKDIHTLPVTYHHNKKAWMTSMIFEEWMRTLDRHFLLQGRSVALILDSSSAHPPLDGLRAITLFFLPPIITSRFQPCDQGIIRSFKTLYRKRILNRFINTFDERESADSHFRMSLLDALVMAAAAWGDVEQVTIQKCFHHAGFIFNEQTSDYSTYESLPPQQGLSEVSSLFERLSDLTPLQLTLEEFLNVDKDTETSEELSQADIASSVQPPTVEVKEEEEEEPVNPIISTKLALWSLEQVRWYIMQHSNGSTALELSIKLENAVQEMITPTRKQSTNDSFFHCT